MPKSGQSYMFLIDGQVICHSAHYPLNWEITEERFEVPTDINSRFCKGRKENRPWRGVNEGGALFAVSGSIVTFVIHTQYNTSSQLVPLSLTVHESKSGCYERTTVFTANICFPIFQLHASLNN